jgi:CheY-like chemotaxis protein/two-component sensor histidine kinase
VTRVYTGEPQQTARYLKTVHRSGKHLLQVINDLLNFSTLEAGKAHLHLEPLDVRDVISELSVNMQSIAIQRGITIETKVPTIDEFKAAGHERPELIADAVKLSQVLINLTSNAIKFSPDNGVVRVDAEVREDKVRFTVADQGIGIPKDKQSLVFESFRQADGSHTRRFGGTGLGLAISKGIVELHQGEIWLESDEGEGSTFFVELPIAGPSREEPEQVSELGGLASMTDAVKGILDRGRAAGDDEQRTVLVVDDDPSVVETVELALQGFNCRVLGLTDSTTAVEQIKKVQPDLLILDIMMPGTSGISILRELRTSNLRNLPVLVSSAYHQNKEVVMALHAEWISKPWQMETIAAEVARMLKVSEFVMGTRERRS